MYRKVEKNEAVGMSYCELKVLGGWVGGWLILSLCMYVLLIPFLSPPT